jgi:predicted secreted hydrolase
MPYRIIAVGLIFLITHIPVATAGDKPFAEASPDRPLIFLRDHGKHPEFQTEWWYFTGNLNSENGKWGFQLTFFRRSLQPWISGRKSAWNIRDIYPAHFAITNLKDGKFFHTELLSREGPGLAAASLNDLDVRVKNWRAFRSGDAINLDAVEGQFALHLALTPGKPLVLHGNGGFSKKGDSPGQSSHYYSYTRLKAKGTLIFDGLPQEVSGLAWMDHEFGSSILSENQVGWDWFSLQLDDGADIMIFYIRRKDGVSEKPFGTLVDTEGKAMDLENRKIFVKPVNQWESPRSGAVYPSGWIVELPEFNIHLKITPLLKDQELSTTGSTQVVYWEGAVGVVGINDGRSVTGTGYAELTGYARSLGGKL